MITLSGWLRCWHLMINVSYFCFKGLRGNSIIVEGINTGTAIVKAILSLPTFKVCIQLFQTQLSSKKKTFVEQQRKKPKAKMMFKTLNYMGPNSLKEYKQYEEKFYVRWSFHLELLTGKYKRK